MAKKTTDEAPQTLTTEQQEQLKALGFNWLALIALAPEAIALVKRIIEILSNPQPTPVFAASGCTHKESLEHALRSAVCTAHCCSVALETCDHE